MAQRLLLFCSVNGITFCWRSRQPRFSLIPAEVQSHRFSLEPAQLRRGVMFNEVQRLHYGHWLLVALGLVIAWYMRKEPV